MFESPIMDERKWSKVPTIPADAFILDLEDAVTPQNKDAARDRVVEYLGKQDYFGGARAVPRINGLDTQWGERDLAALCAAGATTIMCPKIDSVDHVDAILQICDAQGARPELIVGIESMRGVLEADSICAHPSVVCAAFGIGDLALDAGMSLYEPDGSINPGLTWAQVHTVFAARSRGVAIIGMAFARDLKDLDEMRRRIEAVRRLGFTGCGTFYPPHVAIINEAFGPTRHDLERAREIVAAYEVARAQGRPAARLDDGEVVLVHEYAESLRVLSRADAGVRGMRQADGYSERKD